MDKLWKGMNLPNVDVPLSILNNCGIRLDDNNSHEKLKTCLLEEEPDLVIIDSLIRVHGADENSASEMDGVFRQVKKLDPQLKTTFLFTHHTRKFSQGSNSPSQMHRGSTDIRNYVDSYLFMFGRGTSKTLVHNKSRYAVPVPSMMISLEDVGGNATIIQHVEDSPTRVTKIDEAKEFLTKLLKDKDKMARKDIMASQDSIGQNAIDNALKQMQEEGTVRSEGGNGVEKKYWLSEE